MTGRLLLLLIALLLATLPLAAATEYPPSYRWRTIDTAHFFVHFHQGEEELAARAATIAEDVHQRLTRRMNWTPQDRTHLILTDHVDASNGSATTFPRNRIEIYVSSPGADPSSPLEFYDNWVSLVITHEYAHILHLDQARGVSGLLRKVLGRSPIGFPNQFAPPWMIEGLATVVESEETDAGRLKGTFVDMVLRTAAVEGRWPTAAQANGFTAHWPGGNARYFYGAEFLEWVSRREGSAALARYFNEYSANLLPYRVNATAKDVFGEKITTLWREWSAERQAAYRAEVSRLGGVSEAEGRGSREEGRGQSSLVARDGFTSRTRVTSLGYETKYPALSPDGSRIAYGHRGPFEEATIRVRDLADGREVTRRVNTISPLSWSADGRSLAFAQLERHRTFSLLSDLWIWPLDGEPRRITRGARLKDPAFLPGGNAVIAVQNEGGRNRLVQVDVASGAIRPFVTPDDLRQFSQPAVSDDGTRVAVSEWNNGRVDIVVYGRDGARIANLTESLPRGSHASPSFAGSTVLFSSDVTGVSNIFRARAGALERITNVYGGAFFPTSRDGRRVYVADYHANGFDLAAFDATVTYDVTPRALPPLLQRETPTVMAAAQTTIAPTPYQPLRSLAPTWWSPTAVDDEYGIVTGGGDVLGHHTYSAQVTASSDSDLSYGLSYSYDRLYPTFTVAAARYGQDVANLGSPAGETTLYSQTTDRLLAQIAVPYRRYRWQTLGYAAVLRDDVGGPLPAGYSEPALQSVGLFRGTLTGVRVGAVFNNARAFGFSISPENGVTARVDYERMGGDASVQQLRTDLRGFLTIPFARSPLGRHVLAARVAAGRNSGDYIFQRELRVGGVSEGEFIAAGSRDFPVRGYDTGTLRGRQAALASVEYRLPIFDADRGPGTLPFFFNRLVGGVFVDAGTAWDRHTDARQTIASAGAELATDVVIGYWAPLRYRVGVAWRLRAPDRGEVQPFVALSASF